MQLSISPSAFDEIKEAESLKLKTMAEKYEQDMKAMRKEIMEDMKNKMAQLISRLKPKIVEEGLV